MGPLFLDMYNLLLNVWIFVNSLIRLLFYIRWV